MKLSTKNVDKSWVYSQLQEIKEQIRQYIGTCRDFDITTKKDKSIVTKVDLFVSGLIREEIFSNFNDVNYFSEEDQGSFSFPMIILDPIDGTKELVAGNGECAVSFGIYFSPDLDDERNFSWIYNPFTGMQISSEDEVLKYSKRNLDKKVVHVSNTEFQEGLYTNKNDLEVRPVGSIANKLMLLSYGTSDIVVSKRPKNIWDIMAGTHIGHKRGLSFYCDGNKLTSLDQQTYQSDLYWFDEKVFNYSDLNKKL